MTNPSSTVSTDLLTNSSAASSLTYEQRRYMNLMECLDEYLGQEGADTGSGPLLRDIQKACIELKYYHQECVDNFITVGDYFC
jgi:hypothetical protein